MKKEKFELNRYTVLGILSVMLLIFEIIGLSYLISSGAGFGGLLDYVFAFIYCYTIYKTLIKKKELTKWEFIIAIVIIAIGLITTIVGFIYGLVLGLSNYTF